VREKIAEVGIRIDAVGAHQRDGPAEQRMIGGIAADDCEQRELFQSVRKGSRSGRGMIGENPR